MSRFEQFLTSTLSSAGFLILLEQNTPPNNSKPSAEIGHGFSVPRAFAFYNRLFCNASSFTWFSLNRWHSQVCSY